MLVKKLSTYDRLEPVERLDMRSIGLSRETQPTIVGLIEKVLAHDRYGSRESSNIGIAEKPSKFSTSLKGHNRSRDCFGKIQFCLDPYYLLVILGCLENV